MPYQVHYPRNIPRTYLPKLETEQERLLEGGYTKKVTWPTEWTSPILVAPEKGSDDIRRCVDFRRLNRFSKREYYQSPSVIDWVQFINVEQATLFSKFDARKGFHRNELTESLKELTTFPTRFGRFRFERASFGINVIPEHYDRRMNEALQGLPGYTRLVDDTLVYGRDEHEHPQNVRAFLQRCREQHPSERG